MDRAVISEAVAELRRVRSRRDVARALYAVGRRVRATVVRRTDGCMPLHLRLRRYVPIGRARRDTVFVLVSGSEPVPTDEQLAVLDETHRKGLSVEVLALDFDWEPRLAAGATMPGVPIGSVHRRFWRNAPAAGGGGRPRHDTSGMIAIPEWSGRPAPDHIVDGLPGVGITEKSGRTTVAVYDHAAEVTRREEIDDRGRLVRIVDLDVMTGRAVAHRYIDANDACWLSVWLDPDGRPGRAYEFGRKPRAYASLHEAQARWVLATITSTRRPQVLAVGVDAERVAGKIGRGVLC